MKGYFDLDKDLTKSCIVQLCVQLEQALGDGYKVEPLRRCEGGFDVTEWPGKGEEEYKQIRFHIQAHPWPWVPSDWKESWYSADCDIAVKKFKYPEFIHGQRWRMRNPKSYIFFHSCSVWLQNEKKKIKTCLEDHGIIKKRVLPGAARPDPASTRETAGPSPPPPRRAAGRPRRAGATPRSAGWRGSTAWP